MLGPPGLHSSNSGLVMLIYLGMQMWNKGKLHVIEVPTCDPRVIDRGGQTGAGLKEEGV